MMRYARMAAFLALAVVAPAGCGTVRNLAGGDPEIYGGVQKDIAVIETPPTRNGVGINPATLAMFMPVDLCLSAVADTVTLPLAIYLRQNEHKGDDKTASDTSAAPTAR